MIDRAFEEMIVGIFDFKPGHAAYRLAGVGEWIIVAPVERVLRQQQVADLVSNRLELGRDEGVVRQDGDGVVIGVLLA